MMRLTKEQIHKMHTLLCQRTGGCDGLRDEGLLESAIYGIEQGFMGEALYKTPLEKGARLGFSLVKNHAFIDANKRIGVLAMLVYFRLYGISLPLTNDDITYIGLSLASGEMGYEELVRYLRARKS